MLRPRTLVRGNEIIRKNRTIGSTRYTTRWKYAVTGAGHIADAHHAVASRHLQMVLDAGTVIGLSDGQLLDLVESRGDETAFTALMERHGPTVRRACGEVLGNQT